MLSMLVLYFLSICINEMPKSHKGFLKIIFSVITITGSYIDIHDSFKRPVTVLMKKKKFYIL